MSSAHSGDISGYHLSGEWITLISHFLHFLYLQISSVCLSFNPQQMCVYVYQSMRDESVDFHLGCVIIDLLWGIFDSC